MPSLTRADVGGSVTRSSRRAARPRSACVRRSPRSAGRCPPAATTAPSIETIRSPGLEPHGRRRGCLARPASTVVVAFPTEVMKSPVKRTRASRMFAAGPAAIADDALPGRARASTRRAERVLEVVEALLARPSPHAAAGRARRRARAGRAARRARRRGRRPRALLAGGWPRRASAGASLRARARAPCRRRPATGGASRGSSRSRRAGSRRSRTRCRCASSSRSRGGKPM